MPGLINVIALMTFYTNNFIEVLQTKMFQHIKWNHDYYQKGENGEATIDVTLAIMSRWLFCHVGYFGIGYFGIGYYDLGYSDM